MANNRGKFLDAVDKELSLQGPDMQEVVPEASADRATLMARGVVGTVGEIIYNKKQKTEDVLLEMQKKIDELVNLQGVVDEEKQLRLRQEERLTELQTKVNEEKQLRLRQEEKVTKLRTNVKEEKQLRLRQEEKLRELQTEVNDEKQLRLRQEEKLMELQTRVNEEKQLRLDQEEKMIQLRTKLNKETQLRLRQDKKLTELQTKVNEESELRLRQDEKVRELEIKVNKESQLRLSQQQEMISIKEELHEEINKRTADLGSEKKAHDKLVEKYAELSNTLEIVKQMQIKLHSKEYGQQLLIACNVGTPDYNKVRQLLSMGVDCRVEDSNELTLLHHAARDGQVDVCQVILDTAPALVNACSNMNNTPLHLAAWRGHLSVARLLVQHGADHSLMNDHGLSALDRAVSNDHSQVADYLRTLSYSY